MSLLRNLAPLLPLLLAAPAYADSHAFLSGVAKWIALENIPTEYRDQRDWGGQKAFTRGLKFRGSFKDFRIERRKKLVNNGTWKRYHVQILRPAEDIEVEVESIEMQGDKITTRLHLLVKLTAEAELQEWAQGVRLLGVSAVADAAIRITLDCETQLKWNTLGPIPSGELRPQVAAADMTLAHFELQRVGAANGQLIEKLGHELRGKVAEKIDAYEPKLVKKANQSLAREMEKGRLKFDLEQWLRQQF
ncbi:MAG: hypothetical protein ACIALR_07210 [Blastopirellula sp. JB062]